MNNSLHSNRILKILTVGDSRVGKTSIVQQYTTNTFQEQFTATMGSDYMTKFIQYNNEKFQLDIWDTAGQERFKTITIEYIKKSQCIMIVYDVTNRVTFNNLKEWLSIIRKEIGKERVSIVIVGNKIDLNDREVTTEEGKEFAMKNMVAFIEVSAFSNMNIEGAYRMAIDNYYDKKDSNKRKNDKDEQSCCIVF